MVGCVAVVGLAAAVGCKAREPVQQEIEPRPVAERTAAVPTWVSAPPNELARAIFGVGCAYFVDGEPFGQSGTDAREHATAMAREDIVRRLAPHVAAMSADGSGSPDLLAALERVAVFEADVRRECDIRVADSGLRLKFVLVSVSFDRLAGELFRAQAPAIPPDSAGVVSTCLPISRAMHDLRLKLVDAQRHAYGPLPRLLPPPSARESVIR